MMRALARHESWGRSSTQWTRVVTRLDSLRAATDRIALPERHARASQLS